MPWTEPRPLPLAALAFLAANLLHGADHLRQGISGVDLPIKAGGALVTAAAVVVFVLTRQRRPRAPLAAVGVGFAAAFLITQAHLMPHWSVLSNSYIDDVSVDALSWVVVIVEVAAALVLAAAGLHGLREQASGRRTPSIRTAADA